MRALAPCLIGLLLLSPARLWAGESRASRAASDGSAPKVVEARRAASPALAAASEVSAAESACFDRHELGQELRQAGKLLESRRQLEQCAVSACPTAVQRDCARWSTEVADQQPSVVLRITLDGQTRPDARVRIDAEPRASAATQPVSLDPGTHTLEVSHADAKPFELELTLRAGERERRILVELQPAPSTRRVPVLSWVLGGVGIAGAAGFVGFGLSSRSLEQELERRCSPFCSDAEIDRVRRRSLLANVSLGVGLTSLAAAGALFFLSAPEATAPEQPTLALGFVPLDEGALWNVQLRAF